MEHLDMQVEPLISVMRDGQRMENPLFVNRKVGLIIMEYNGMV